MELNKALRFYRQNGDVGLTFDHISDDTKDWLLVGVSDASWGTRPDGSSQGGFLVGLTHKNAL
eukprot:1183001-Prorocentrum_lima.AAC.1